MGLDASNAPDGKWNYFTVYSAELEPYNAVDAFYSYDMWNAIKDAENNIFISLDACYGPGILNNVPGTETYDVNNLPQYARKAKIADEEAPSFADELFGLMKKYKARKLKARGTDPMEGVTLEGRPNV